MENGIQVRTQHAENMQTRREQSRRETKKAAGTAAAVFSSTGSCTRLTKLRFVLSLWEDPTLYIITTPVFAGRTQFFPVHQKTTMSSIQTQVTKLP